MGVDRRRLLLAHLRRTAGPLPGGELARRLGVSRQVIVQDVAVLRAGGAPVVATPHGYYVERARDGGVRAVLAVRHGRRDTALELNTLVDLGLEILDVTVEHPIYGELRGLLRLRSRADVRRLVLRLHDSGAGLLSEVTGGLHLHTVAAPNRVLIARAKDELRRRGLLVEG